MRLCLMAHQESRPTSTPPFEEAFSSLCWSVTPQFSSRIKTQFTSIISTIVERWDLVLELGIANSIICLLKHSAHFGKFTVTSNCNIDNALWLFAKARAQLLHNILWAFCIWKMSFSKTHVCILLPNTLFRFSTWKQVFWLLKVEPNAHLIPPNKLWETLEKLRTQSSPNDSLGLIGFQSFHPSY